MTFVFLYTDLHLYVLMTFTNGPHEKIEREQGERVGLPSDDWQYIPCTLVK